MGAHLTKGATSHGKSYSPADGPVRRAVVSLFVCQPIGGHGTAKSSRPSCSNAFLSLLLRCTSRSDCCSSCSGRGVSSYFTLWQVRSHFLTHRILSLALAHSRSSLLRQWPTILLVFNRKIPHACPWNFIGDCARCKRPI